MMRHISNDLARRARFLAHRDGYRHEMVNDGPVFQVLVIEGMSISVDEENVLRIRRKDDDWDAPDILIEGPIGTLIETSPDEVLEAAIEKLQPYMVLDDLADL